MSDIKGEWWREVIPKVPSPVRVASVHLRKQNGKWECFAISARFSYGFLGEILGTGDTPKEAYERAFPSTSLGRIAKWWREL